MEENAAAIKEIREEDMVALLMKLIGGLENRIESQFKGLEETINKGFDNIDVLL